MNLHFSFSVNGSSFHSFKHDFYQTTTDETNYVLEGCPLADPEDWYGSPPPYVTSQDREWPLALSRLREITKKRGFKKSLRLKSLSFIDDIEKCSKVPGTVVKIYSM